MNRSCSSSEPINQQIEPANGPLPMLSEGTSATTDFTARLDPSAVRGDALADGSYPVAAGSVLSVLDLDLNAVGRILDCANALEKEDPRKRALRLHKRRVALLFYESSTRTRTSFELAAKGLGADTTLISSLSSSIEKGESLKDTGITLRALGAECIILRHLSSGAPWLLARSTGLPVLNAGDGMHEHPSQALLDLRTILAHLRPETGPSHPIDENTLKGLTVTIVGDIRHSRVARSNALLLPQFGARVLLCGPPALLPETAAAIGLGIEIERDFTAALRQSQVVIMLRIQAERLAGLELNLEDYKAGYQANAERIAAHAPDALIMHPGPMIRGLEITSEVADGPHSAIAEQVHHGVAIRMALVYLALADRTSPSHAATTSGATATTESGVLKRPRGRPKKLLTSLPQTGGRY